uniref:Sodium/potassium-transporting ATPase subunit beta-1-interacting protein n=1 Tax=Lygus hesperus TaxID=30085 RepID=A0A0A9Z6A6_LYGHE
MLKKGLQPGKSSSSGNVSPAEALKSKPIHASELESMLKQQQQHHAPLSATAVPAHVSPSLTSTLNATSINNLSSQIGATNGANSNAVLTGQLLPTSLQGHPSGMSVASA